MDNKADKLRKKLIKDQQKRIKPGECLKYVRLVLSSSLLSSSIGTDLITELSNSQQKYEIRSLLVENCIIWERNVGQRLLLLDEPAALNGLDDEWKIENQVVQIFSTQQLQRLMKDASLESIAKNLRKAYPDKKHSLVITCAKEKNFKNSNITNALVELQVLQSINVQQIPCDVKELVAVLRRFTKSIAEAPFKQQKSETLEGFKKYLANDKKQCVRVEGTNGFGRLWQQHLNRLPLVTLEVAETIIAQYSCPKKLLDEYANNANAKNTIADLRISRGGPQPLQTDRRIGNVLSNKLHTIYSTTDPNALV